MSIWMIFYAIAHCLVVHFGNLVTPAFNKRNMLPDPVTLKSRYVVSDYKGRVKIVPLNVGVYLSMYSVVTTICIIALTLLSLFYAEKWWHAVLTFAVTSFVIFPVFNRFFKLSLFSILFYIELIAIPFLIFFTNYYLVFTN